MGGSVSHGRPLRMQEDDADDQIDVDDLFEALLKLTCVFEIKESLTTSLINEITDPRHDSFDAQFYALEVWLQRHAEADLTPQEMFALIQYVELYEPRRPPNEDIESYPHLEGGLAVEEDTPAVNKCPLICPYRSEIPAWTATIRSEELKKDPFRDDITTDTANLSAQSLSSRPEGITERFRGQGRPRGDSDMSDLSVV